MSNKDKKVIKEFGEEWVKFDYSSSNINTQKLKENFDQYFCIFPWEILPEDAIGFDMGGGTGRWAQFVAPRVKKLNFIEPSDAINVAKNNLINHSNVTYLRETTESCTIEPESQDFGYSLGVLHHIPDTSAAISACAKLLKPGAPLLLYLYYDFENRPWWFRRLWRISDFIRRIIYRLPPSLKHIITDIIAVLVYVPFTTFSRLIERIGFKVDHVPLSYYRKCSFYTMRTDARDRFGTPLEHRFSRKEISEMMAGAGLVNVRFSEKAPYWCVVGIKDK